MDETLSFTRMEDDGASGKESAVSAVKQMRFLISKSIGWRFARMREDRLEFDLNDLDMATMSGRWAERSIFLHHACLTVPPQTRQP